MNLTNVYSPNKWYSQIINFDRPVPVLFYSIFNQVTEELYEELSLDFYAFCHVFQAASHVHGGHFAAGFVDGSVRLYDVRKRDM